MICLLADERFSWAAAQQKKVRLLLLLWCFFALCSFLPPSAAVCREVPVPVAN
jgi:hypothetical protein